MSIYSLIKRNFKLLFCFGLVGTLGSIINISAYSIFTNIYGFNVNYAAILAFFIAAGNNYILNHYWTFAEMMIDKPLNVRNFSRYVMVNIFGLIINLIVLNLLIYNFGLEFHIQAQFLGILSGMMLNFIFSKKVVFN
ncbi:GtrA family protein [Candidatus Woesearchaeota archaeon]|jgi:putative flippase GtrA|nr:GtrA family protein [Candidatus Woesearchaeota archaeon]MBT7557076.1 GtrA family protein [Candidatus Woesearchaeota archaeon]